MCYAVLGPRGTFSEEAARLYWGYNVELYPAETITEVFKMVEEQAVAAALVPIENSLTGLIQPTLEGLESCRVNIAGETVLSICQHLMAARKYHPGEIELLISNHTALMQCESFIKENMPGIRLEITDSTARAAQLLLMEKKKAASIGNDYAAKLYGLHIIRSDIADGNNYTRFVHIIAGDANQSGNKCSLMFSLPDQAGALYEVLGVFARHHLNLGKIESRPHQKKKERFTFYIEVQLPGVNFNLDGLFAELAAYCCEVKHLGSYFSMK